MENIQTIGKMNGYSQFFWNFVVSLVHDSVLQGRRAVDRAQHLSGLFLNGLLRVERNLKTAGQFHSMTMPHPMCSLI